MLDCSAAQITKMVIHYVGNKGREERLVLSDNHLRSLAVEEEELFLEYFLKPFKNEDYQAFHHHSSLEMNEAYNYVHSAFEVATEFLPSSRKLAGHLFESSEHPRINGGEFYMVHFADVVVDGEAVEAIGLFKSERKEFFLSINPDTETFGIEFDQGIDVRKLDKGCLVLKHNAAEGYKVLTHDQLSKGEEAQYWKEDFLGVAPTSNEYAMTKNYMSMCKSFVTEQMPQEFEVDKATQIDLLNRSSDYFTESESVSDESFTQHVLEQPEIIESFQSYREQYTEEHGVDIQDEFDTSSQAVKQGKKLFKSVLKLDKNFSLYVHGNREYIEKGFDEEKGMKFYKVFYNEEK